MAKGFSLNQLVTALGKNADDFNFSGLSGKAKSKAIDEATAKLNQEFNRLIVPASKWGGVEDFSSLSATKKLELVGNYEADMRAKRESYLTRHAEIHNMRHTEYQGDNVPFYNESEVAERKQAITGKKIERERISMEKEFAEKSRAERIEESMKEMPDKFIGMEEQARNAKITQSQNYYNNAAGINFNKLSDIEKASVQGKYDKLFGSSKYNSNPYNYDAIIKGNKIDANQKNNNDRLKRELTERKIQRESGIKPETVTARDRQASPLTAEERKARGLSGQSKTEYDVQMKEERRNAANIQKKLNEAQDVIDKQNRPLHKRTLDNLNDKGRAVVSNVKDTLTGTKRNNNATFATDYNKIMSENGKTDFIDLKQAARLQKKYNGMSPQEVYEAKQKGLLGGLKDKASEAIDKASEVASETNFMEYFGQAWDWATQDTQHALMVAGGAVGVGILGAEILDDDDDY